MKNLKKLFLNKAKTNKRLIFLLFFGLLAIPNCLFSQTEPPLPPPLGFKCSFSNPDGVKVYTCLSTVTATITLPTTANAVLNKIKMIFPNSFSISGWSGCNPSSILAVGIAGQEISSVNVPDNALISKEFNITTTGTITIEFFYSGCNNYPITADANISALFFDCTGFDNLYEYSASIQSPPPGNLGLEISNNQIARAYNEASLLPIQMLNSSGGTSESVISTGNTQNTYPRIFSIKINSMAVTSFRLNISDEADASESNLRITNSSGPNFPLTNNTGENTIVLSSLPTGCISINGTTRTLNIRQDYTLSCPIPPTEDPFGIIKTLITSNSTLCNCSTIIESNGLVFNGKIGGRPAFRAPSSTFKNVSSDPNSPCPGTFDYEVKFYYNPSEPGKLVQIKIPVDLNYFDISQIFIGSNVNDAIPNPVESYTPIPNNFYSFNEIGPYSAINPQLLINVNAFVAASNNFSGCNPNYNGSSLGAWINTYPYATNPTNFINSLFLKIRLTSKPAYLNPTGCPAERVRVTPIQNNKIEFVLQNTCSQSVAQVLPGNPNPTVFNLTNILSDNISSTITANPAVTTFDIPSIGPNATARFYYTISLPPSLQDPFHIGSTSLISDEVHCNSPKYRARLSRIGTANMNSSTITSLNIDNTVTYNDPISNVDGSYTFMVPLSTSIIDFTLQGIDCPSNDPDVTYGNLDFIFTIEAFCEGCNNNNFVRTIGCVPNSISVHCQGGCTGTVVGTHADPLPKIERTTFGYRSPSYFPDTPIESLAGFNLFLDDLLVPANDPTRLEQLLKLYPYDVFSLNVHGDVTPIPVPLQHNSLSLEIMYETDLLGEEFFEFENYEATFHQIITPGANPVLGPAINISTANNPTIIPIFTAAEDLPMPVAPEPVIWSNPMSIRQLQFTASQLSDAGININTNAYTIEIKAKFRITATAATVSTDHEFVILRNQFVTMGSNDLQNNSCDPYGAGLIVIIPDVELGQINKYTGAMEFTSNGVTSNVGNINTENPKACKYGHAIGIKHTRGLGALPDFYYEFRPLTAWPNQISSTSTTKLVKVDDFFTPATNPFSLVSPFMNQTSPGAPLLPPLERGEIPNTYQGLLLTLDKECPNSESIVPFPSDNSPLPSPPDFHIDPYAYVHWEIANNPPPAALTLAPINEVPTTTTCSEVFNFPGTLTSTITIPNGGYNYQFVLNLPAAMKNSSSSLPVALRITTTSLISEVSLGNIFRNISGTPTELTPNNGWYFFDDLHQNTNASIYIDMVDDCFAEEIVLNFEWHVFCDPDDAVSFINGTNPSPNVGCFSCTTERKFQRGQGIISNATITSNFVTEDCKLKWTLSITNPPNQPTINLNDFNLNFATGLIYQPSPISSVTITDPVLGVISPSPTLSPPVFSLYQASGVSYNWVQTSIQMPELTLFPGQTLTYTVYFLVSEGLCRTFDQNNTNTLIEANFYGKNICNNVVFNYLTIPINNTNLSSALNAISLTVDNLSPEVSCCQAPPFIIKHVCVQSPPDGPDGKITITNTAFVFDPLFNNLMNVKLTKPSDPLFSAIEQIGIVTPNYVINNLDIGTYILEIFNQNNGEYFVGEITIENYSISTSLTTSLSTLCQGSPVTLTANATPIDSPSDIPYIFTYTWTPINSSTTNTATYNPDVTTYYQVTVSNGSCSATANAEVVVNATPTLSSTLNPPAICSNTVFSYSPSSLLSGANFTWTREEVAGITNAAITTPQSANPNETLLNTTTNTINVVYAYTISANGCSNTQNVTVTVNPLPTTPTITASGSTTFCQGGNVVLTSSSGASYSWSNGETTQAINVSSSGSYSLAITNSNGCSTSSAVIPITVNPLPTAPTITANGSTTFCQGGSTTLTSSTAASYLWSNGATTQSITVNTSGNYSVEITDANGCSANSAAIPVTVNPLPNNPSIFTVGPTTFCEGNSVLLFVISNGTYLWSTGATTPSITVNTSGSYSVAITNANGCTSNLASTTVTVHPSPTEPTISASGNTTFCQGGNVVLTSSNAVSYLWSNGETTALITANTSGNYTVEITDANGCTAASTAPMTVTVNPNPIVSITASPGTIIQLGTSVNLEATFSPTGADVSWFGPNIISGTNPITASPTENSDYTVTVTANGCSIQETISIQVVDASLACLNNPNTIIIPDGFTSSQLVELMQNNYLLNINPPSGSSITWTIFSNPNEILNFALLGEFIIDNVVVFANVNFYCNSNSAILNSSFTGAFGFGTCNFYACGQNQWRGIENAGLLIAFDCNINNAVFAINAFENSRNYLLRNIFDNNLVGFYADLPQGSSIYFYNRENTYTNTGTLLPTFILNTLFNFNKSICGIYLNNAGNIQIDQPNNSTSNTRFLDINCGISSNNTNLRVNNASFENIALHNFPPFNTPIYSGCGIYQGSNGSNTLSILPAFGINNGTTFENCVNGIRLNHTNATIKNIGFENVGIGVMGNYLEDTKVIIDKNKINARRFGIHLTAIDNAQYIVANNNEIKVESSKSNSGIYMSAFHNQNNVNSNIKIQANSIKVSNGINGIQLTNIFHPKVNSNKVYRNTISPLMISYEWAGIKSEACDRADISCNEILPGVSEIQNNGGADIHISQSPNTWLAANIANGGAYKGIEFQGASNNSTVQTNVIEDHNIGLYYGTSAFVGPQPANATSSTSANKWNGSYTNPNNNAGAVNENIWDNSGTTPVLDLTTIAQNQFRVNGTSGQDPFYPENYPDNALGTNWFTYLPNPNLPPFTGGYCITSPVGNNGGGGGVSNNTGVVTNVGPYMAVAEGSVSSTQYKPETEWMLKKELLKILAIEDSLRNSNETLFFFYNNSTNDNIKELLSIEERLRTENEIITINRYLMNLNDSILAIKDSLILTNFILANDSLQQEYAMEQINTLNQEYTAIQQENRQLLNQITQIRQDSVLISEQRNIAFSPNNFNEYLLKQVNEVYFKSYAKGLDTLTLGDIEVLENIIHICPQAGGPAVYKARALYATINDTIVYNDSTVCRQIGYYRTIKDEIETKIIEAKKEISLINNSSDNISFRLFPNPVKDKLTVKINGEIENGTLKILDALGKTIYLQQIKKNQQEIFIDASSFSDGYYILQIITSNYNGNQKFIK